MNAILEITKESGEIIHTEQFIFEKSAHDKFEELELIKYPLTYMNLTMNLSEYQCSKTIGSVRVVAVDEKGNRYIRRELYRKA